MEKGSIYELDGGVPLKQAIPLGLQHVLAMFVGNVSPLIIVAGLLNMPSEQKTMLIQNAMFIAGLITLIQLYPIGRVGSRLPIVMGTSSGFVPTIRAAAGIYGYGAVLGASLVGGLFESILGFFIKPLRKIFPPIVTGTVVISIGLSLIPIGITYFAGGFGASDFGSVSNLFLGSVVIVVILFCMQFTKGFFKVSAVLTGIVAGYILAILMGKVDFTPIAQADWFSLPKAFMYKMEFKIGAIIPMCIMYIATTVETIGDISAVTAGGLNREATDRELAGGVLADGVGSMIAAFFGVLPNTSFSQNVGLIGMTKVVNRFSIMTGAVILILAGFFPKLGGIISAVPQSVLGGATIIMFSMIAISGMQLIFKQNMYGRNAVIVAVALGLGLGLGSTPDALQHLPEWTKLVFAQNGIVVAFIVAVILNLILPQDKKEKAEEGIAFH
ncbi:uracil-xanthine permease family protein [Cellulosilyticum sp. I15G10I2]|uniref:uracil-xanthine permease family protein n=1 Tax=Cellulosilyticum sp. I15G10I2 TaxID=1892843 RepID=UPI00085BBD68|nr:nucleobase:cation symporter-2 family protein [Cellulosilyticum sp. I15G10I2]